MFTKNEKCIHAAIRIGLLSLFIIGLALYLQGCSDSRPSFLVGPTGPQGIEGPAGAAGPQGYGSGTMETSLPDACDGNGGVEIVTFQDVNNTGIFSAGDTVTSSEIVCNGSQGATGAQGSPGLNCTANTVQANSGAPNGGALISCPDGSQSLILNGSNGTDGTDGTIVTAIQFCSSASPDYPSTFPEVGFCIDNTLYAVYSTNDGFLSEIPPGEYESDGVNASCTFTIGPNCQVTN